MILFIPFHNYYHIPYLAILPHPKKWFSMETPKIVNF